MKRPVMQTPSRRGTIVVVVMVLLLVTMSIAIAVLQAATLDARQLVIDRRAMQADRLAEAGLARAMLRLSEDDYDGEDWRAELSGGRAAVVAIRIEDNDGRRTVVAVATWPPEGDRRVRSRRTVITRQSTP